MSKVKLFLSFGLILFYYQSVSQKNFVLLETNLDKNKVQQCLSTARRCEAVLLRNSPPTSLNFSENSSITNNSVNNLIERFNNAYPKSKPSSSNDPLIERVLVKEKPNAIRLTYSFLPQDQSSTLDFVQMIILFDPKDNMKVLDMFVRGKSEVGAVTLTEREKLKFKKPEPPAPTPVVKATPSTESNTKTTTATKKTPAKKTTTKTPTKSQAKTGTTTPKTNTTTSKTGTIKTGTTKTSTTKPTTKPAVKTTAPTKKN